VAERGGFRHVVVGLLLDSVDWLGFGAIPVIGDIIDLVGVAYFWRVLGPIALAGLIELIPVADILPTYTALGVYAYMRGGRRD